MGERLSVQEIAKKVVADALEHKLEAGMLPYVLEQELWEMLIDDYHITDTWYPDLLVYFGADTAYNMPSAPSTTTQLMPGDIVIVDVTPMRDNGDEGIEFGDHAASSMFMPEGYNWEDDGSFLFKKALLQFSREATMGIMGQFKQRYSAYVGEKGRSPVGKRDQSISAAEFYQSVIYMINLPIISMIERNDPVLIGLSGRDNRRRSEELHEQYGGYHFCLIGEKQEIGHRVDESLIGRDSRESICPDNNQYVNRHPIWTIGPHIGIRDKKGELLPFGAKFEDILYFG